MKTWYGGHTWDYQVHLSVGKGDGWGFAVEFFPSDKALSLHFIRWYFIIEIWRKHED